MQYILQHGEILSVLVTRSDEISFWKPFFLCLCTSSVTVACLNSYENPQIALTAGTMLRECIRFEPLARQLLESDLFTRFFSYVELSNFDVASDAFATFKDVLTRHKPMVADFLSRNFDRVLTQYGTLLNSQNYVTRRQSIKVSLNMLVGFHSDLWFAVTWRAPPRPSELQCDDEVHQRPKQPQSNDDVAQRPQQEYPV